MPIYPFINLFNAPNIMKNLITLPIKSKFYQDMGLDMFWVRFLFPVVCAVYFVLPSLRVRNLFLLCYCWQVRLSLTWLLVESGIFRITGKNVLAWWWAWFYGAILRYGLHLFARWWIKALYRKDSLYSIHEPGDLSFPGCGYGSLLFYADRKERIELGDDGYLLSVDENRFGVR